MATLAMTGFARTCGRQALRSADLGFHVTPHGLRHAHASWLLAGGADIQVVKERLGHGSIVTTEKYLRALPNAHDAAIDALAAIRGTRQKTDATGGMEANRDTDVAEIVRAMEKLKELPRSGLGGVVLL